MTVHGLIGWILAASSAVVLVVFSSRYGILAPELLRDVGLTVGVTILLGLAAFGAWLRSWRILMLVGLGAGIGAGGPGVDRLDAGSLG